MSKYFLSQLILKTNKKIFKNLRNLSIEEVRYQKTDILRSQEPLVPVSIDQHLDLSS